MKSIWLGQGGLLLISGKLKVVVDPYLSNSMKAFDRSKKRKLKVKRRFLRVKPDMIILTNSHPDHADPKTLKKYLHKTKKRTVVLASSRAYDKLQSERIVGRYTNIMFEEGDEWTLDHLLIKGVKCKTDDKTAYGVIIEDSYTREKIYIAGNTLYNKYLVEDLPKDIDVAYIPISGQYSNMNIRDAERFALALKAKKVVPFHYGLFAFDKTNPKDFACENKIVPKPFKVIPLDAETEETRKLSAEERLKMGLEEKPTPVPKSLKAAIKAEKIEDKQAKMREKLVDSIKKFVEGDGTEDDSQQPSGGIAMPYEPPAPVEEPTAPTPVPVAESVPVVETVAPAPVIQETPVVEPIAFAPVIEEAPATEPVPEQVSNADLADLVFGKFEGEPAVEPVPETQTEAPLEEPAAEAAPVAEPEPILDAPVTEVTSEEPKAE